MLFNYLYLVMQPQYNGQMFLLILLLSLFFNFVPTLWFKLVPFCWACRPGSTTKPLMVLLKLKRVQLVRLDVVPVFCLSGLQERV